jgi:hypothetical protein
VGSARKFPASGFGLRNLETSRTFPGTFNESSPADTKIPSENPDSAHGVSFQAPIKGMKVTRNFRGVPNGDLERSSGLERLL